MSLKEPFLVQVFLSEARAAPASASASAVLPVEVAVEVEFRVVSGTQAPYKFSRCLAQRVAQTGRGLAALALELPKRKLSAPTPRGEDAPAPLHLQPAAQPQQPAAEGEPAASNSDNTSSSNDDKGDAAAPAEAQAGASAACAFEGTNVQLTEGFYKLRCSSAANAFRESYNWAVRFSTGGDISELDASKSPELKFRRLAQQIKKDVHRTPLTAASATEELTTQERARRSNSLYKVLLAYAAYDTKVGYCQGMNFVVALALRMGLSDEESFWLVKSLAETVSCGYWTEEMEGVVVDQLIFEHLLQEHQPQVAHHLEAMALNVSLFIGPWLPQLFLNVFNDEALEAFWDTLMFCLLHTVERGKVGRRVIMCAALAILKLNTTQVLELHDVSDALPYLSSQMPRAVNARELVAGIVEQMGLYTTKVFQNLTHQYRNHLPQRLREVVKLEEELRATRQELAVVQQHVEVLQSEIAAQGVKLVNSHRSNEKVELQLHRERERAAIEVRALKQTLQSREQLLGGTQAKLRKQDAQTAAQEAASVTAEERARHAEELHALRKALEATQQLSQAGDEAMKRQIEADDRVERAEKEAAELRAKLRTQRLEHEEQVEQFTLEISALQKALKATSELLNESLTQQNAAYYAQQQQQEQQQQQQQQQSPASEGGLVARRNNFGGTSDEAATVQEGLQQSLRSNASTVASSRGSTNSRHLDSAGASPTEHGAANGSEIGAQMSSDSNMSLVSTTTSPTASLAASPPPQPSPNSTSGKSFREELNERWKAARLKGAKGIFGRSQ